MVQMKSNEKKNGKAVHLVFLGLQFNRSEHRPVKAEAAGSSPVSPELGLGSDPEFSIFREKGDREQDLIPRTVWILIELVLNFASYMKTNTRFDIYSTSAEC